MTYKCISVMTTLNVWHDNGDDNTVFGIIGLGGKDVYAFITYMTHCCEQVRHAAVVR